MERVDEMAVSQRGRGVIVPVVLWLLFGGGLLLQVFSPHLKVEHDSFVIPADAAAKGSVLDPRELVHRQRMIEGFSAGLVLVGVVGLGFWYRDALRRSVTGK